MRVTKKPGVAGRRMPMRAMSLIPAGQGKVQGVYAHETPLLPLFNDILANRLRAVAVRRLLSHTVTRAASRMETALCTAFGNAQEKKGETVY